MLAHVPDLNDFVEGMKIVLKQDGVITMEFPHLLRMIESNQFDTIYHEHFSYLSFQTVEKIFAHHGLVMFDVEVIFFYPYAVNFKSLGWAGFFEVVLFVGFFLVGFVYIIKKGALKWED